MQLDDDDGDDDGDDDQEEDERERDREKDRERQTEKSGNKEKVRVWHSGTVSTRRRIVVGAHLLQRPCRHLPAPVFLPVPPYQNTVRDIV